MKVDFEHNGTKMILNYGENGSLDKVYNCDTNKNMMMETYQEGMGYKIERHNGYMPMDVCNGVYIRIMDLNVFVPKYMFISNEEEL